MDRKSAIILLNSLYQSINGFALSKDERTRKGIESNSLTYGEINYETFADILDIVKPSPNDIFVDLGCGVGKAVLFTALTTPVAKSIGVEILEDIHNASQSVLDTIQQGDYKKFFGNTKIEFIHEDIFDFDITRGTIFFVSTTCFTIGMMVRLSHYLKQAPRGTRVITLTQPLYSDYYQQIHTSFKPMSWGNVTVYVYEKIPSKPKASEPRGFGRTIQQSL